jgi:hypothetical protein
LNRAERPRNVKDEWKIYKIGTAALQQIKWEGVGIMYIGNFSFFYNCKRNKTLGTGLLVDKITSIQFQSLNLLIRMEIELLISPVVNI